MARLNQKAAGVKPEPLQGWTSYEDAIAIVRAALVEDASKTKCWFQRTYGYSYAKLGKMESEGVAFGKPTKSKVHIKLGKGK